MIFNSQLQHQILFLLQNQCYEVKEHMSKYQNRLKNKIHQKSHLCSKSTTVPPLKAKRERHRAERQFLKTGLTVFKEMFCACNKVVNSIVHQAKTSFYNAKILFCTTFRQLFNFTGSLLDKTKSTPLPMSLPSAELPSRFSDYFSNTTSTIRQNLDSSRLLSLLYLSLISLTLVLHG